MREAPLIPDEIIEAATKTVSIHFYNCDAGDSWRDCENCVLLFDRAKRTILAALPALAEQVRREAAQQIAAAIRERGHEAALDCWCHDKYADLARQTGESTR